MAQLRQLAGENGDLAGVLYLGSVPERTTDVHAVLDSLPEQPWQFVADIPADRWVAAPGGGRELYCIFAVRKEGYAFVYEKQDPSTRTRRAGSFIASTGWPAHSAAVQRQPGHPRHHGGSLLHHWPRAGLVASAFCRDRQPGAGGGRRRFFPTPNVRRCP